MQTNKDKTIVWHTSYDVVNPPKKPSENFVRFIVISDTHGTQPKVPEGDVLLHSGDFSELGSTTSLEKQFKWLDTLPHTYKFVIGGNHDFSLCTRDNWYETRGKELLKEYKGEICDPEDIKRVVREWQSRTDRIQRYLECEKAEFDLKGRTWSIYGSPWTPEFESWAWNYNRGKEAKEMYSKFPLTDILLTHGPPHKIGGLDVLTDGVTSVGCEETTERLEKGDLRPFLYCFGHIHEAQGTHLQNWQNSFPNKPNETLCINSAIVEFDPDIFAKERRMVYSIVHQPIIVDVDPTALSM